MLVFIDESGDSGFRLDKGSTTVFAVAMVIFDDHQQAALADQAIRNLMTEWGVKPEFKFSKASNDVRDVFFAAVAPFDFRVRAIVVEKDLIHSGRLRSSKEDFYRFFVKSMVKFDNGHLTDARVIIDGSGERTFRRGLQSHLKRHSGPGAIKDVRMKASHGDPLVQLADNVCRRDSAILSAGAARQQSLAQGAEAENRRYMEVSLRLVRSLVLSCRLAGTHALRRQFGARERLGIVDICHHA